MNNSREDRPVPAAELYDDELAKVVGGVEEIHITKHFDVASPKLYEEFAHKP